MKKMMKKLSVPAMAIAAFAACADPAGLGRTLVRESGSLAVTVNPGTVNSLLPKPAGMLPGTVRVCKDTPAGDPSQDWSFTVSVASQIDNAPLNPVVPPSSPRIISGVAGGAPECLDVFFSTKNGLELDVVTITEQALPQYWALTDITIDRYVDGAGYTPPAGTPLDAGSTGTGVATLYVNADMQRVVTFRNDFTAPPTITGCTFTKGWYQNKNGSPTVTAVDGRTKAEAQAIFKGQYTTSNTSGNNINLNLLGNVYQQTLAAILNLGGDGHENDGPAEVDAAIALALGGIGGTGTNIINQTLTQAQLGALATTLANFNEGKYVGWPHCDD